MSVSTRPPGPAGPERPFLQGETRRDGILEAALAIMSRKGFERASIAAIAGRAGVARATVYQHFCDKQDILVALAERITRRIIETIETWAPLPRCPAAGERELRAMIDTRVAQILGAIAANADATRLVARLTRGSDRAPTHDFLRKIDDHVVAVLTREIQAASVLRPRSQESARPGRPAARHPGKEVSRPWHHAAIIGPSLPWRSAAGPSPGARRVPLGQFNPPRFGSMGARDAASSKEGSMSLTGSMGVLHVAVPVERAAAQVVPSHGHRDATTEGGGSR